MSTIDPFGSASPGDVLMRSLSSAGIANACSTALQCVMGPESLTVWRRVSDVGVSRLAVDRS